MSGACCMFCPCSRPIGHALTLARIAAKFLCLGGTKSQARDSASVADLCALVHEVEMLSSLVFTGSITRTITLAAWERRHLRTKVQDVIATHFVGGSTAARALPLTTKITMFQPQSRGARGREWDALLVQVITTAGRDYPRLSPSIHQMAQFRRRQAVRSGTGGVGGGLSGPLSPLSVLAELVMGAASDGDESDGDRRGIHNLQQMFEQKVLLLDLCVRVVFDHDMDGRSEATWTRLRRIVEAVDDWQQTLQEGDWDDEGDDSDDDDGGGGDGERERQTDGISEEDNSFTHPASSVASHLVLAARIEEARSKWVPAGLLMHGRGMPITPADFQLARSADLAEKEAEQTADASANVDGDANDIIEDAGGGKRSRAVRSGPQLLEEFVVVASRQLDPATMDRSNWWEFVADCVGVAELGFYWLPRRELYLVLGTC